jgi:hypothetical protein
MNNPFTYVIVTTRSSKALRQALSEFAAAFDAKFNNPGESVTFVGQFEPALELIEEIFPFVPIYDKETG